MEVNVCPSLSSSSPIDRKIKHTLLTDTLNLIGLEYNNKKYVQHLKKK
jgi:tubulin polyglutamylase TTLL4